MALPDDTPLAHACRALWRSTLPLMQAHAEAGGPARRVMLARRIACNIDTLLRHGMPLAPAARAALLQLARRWAGLAGWRRALR